MAVVSAHAKLVIQDAATHGGVDFRRWDATATVQDTAAGLSVVITTAMTTAGGTAALLPDTLTLSLFNDSGTLIRSFTLTPSSTSQTSTFFFTSDGTSGGAARCGTVEIAIRATNTTGGVGSTYDVSTTGSPNTPPTGKETVLDRGWIRGTTTATQVLSNISLGGGKTSPFSFGDSVFLRTTLGAVPYVSAALTHAVGSVLSASPSSSTVNFDSTFTGGSPFTSGVNNAFPASSSTQTTGVTSFANATLTGQPWTTATVTTDSATVDPRLTLQGYMQLDDNAYQTPPDGLSDSSHNVMSRLNSNIGFVACRVKNAQGAGVNGITWTHSLRDLNSLAADLDTASSTTGTAGGATGWDTAFFSWTGQLPSGAYNLKRTVTAPAGATGLFTGSSSTGTATLTLLAPNSAIRVLVGAGPYEALLANSDKDHWHPGDPLLVGVAMLNTTTQKVVTPDSSPAPGVMVGRFNQALGRAEFYDSDNTWKATNGATVYIWPCSASPGDAQTFIRTFAAVNTTNWSWADLFVVGICYQNGTPYSGPASVPVLDKANPHLGYSIDAVGFALSGFGLISQH